MIFVNVKPYSLIRDGQGHQPGLKNQAHPGLIDPSMAGHIRQRLLSHAKEHRLLQGVQALASATDLERNGQAGALPLFIGEILKSGHQAEIIQLSGAQIVNQAIYTLRHLAA